MAWNIIIGPWSGFRMRIVSIWLPHFSLERRRRPHTAVPRAEGAAPAPDVPFVLTAKGAKGLRLTAVNNAARKLGLKTGMALTDARALFPAVLSAPADAEEDSRTLRRLALWCTRFTPSAAEDGADGLRLDITGSAHLWGGEANLARDIKARLAALGFTARLGIADTFGAAWALARFGRRNAAEGAVATLAISLTVLFPAAFPAKAGRRLAGLPVEALRLAPETTELLKRLGFYRIGDLYDLPRVSLKRRFPAKDAAEAALLRLDQALGERPEPAPNVEASPAYLARRDFAEPLIAAEGVEQAVEDSGPTTRRPIGWGAEGRAADCFPRLSGLRRLRRGARRAVGAVPRPRSFPAALAGQDRPARCGIWRGWPQSCGGRRRVAAVVAAWIRRFAGITQIRANNRRMDWPLSSTGSPTGSVRNGCRGLFRKRAGRRSGRMFHVRPPPWGRLRRPAPLFLKRWATRPCVRS